MHAVAGHDGPVTCVAMAHDGSICITGDSAEPAIVWDMVSGELLYTIDDHRTFATVTSVAIPMDTTKIATGCQDGCARVFCSSNPFPATYYAGHASGVTAVAFTPDGSTLVTGCEDIA